LTWPKEILFDLMGKKIKNLGFLGEIFQTQTQTISKQAATYVSHFHLLKVISKKGYH